MRRMARFSSPISSRKVPDTPGPTTAPACGSGEQSRAPLSPRTPATTSAPSANTIVECPSEKKKPTLNGRCPSAISLRVVLSIAPMWSASNACRSPSV